MELLSWLKWRNGTRVDFPDGDGGQCVDLANDYLGAVWGADPVRANAEDWPMTHIDGAAYIFNVENRPGMPGNYPPVGAVVCWRGPEPTVGITGMGHVAVCLAASTHYILSVDQNWGGVKIALLRIHDYRGVHGWWSRTAQQ